MIARAQTHRTCSQQGGFALPMVLVAIAALALITVTAYRSISSSADIVTSLRAEAEAKRSLFSAESEAAFVFLTSAPASGGIITQSEIFSGTDYVLNGADITSLEPAQYWRADGGERISAPNGFPVVVTYFDAAGAAPIDSLRGQALVDILIASGFDKIDAQTIAARIEDYQDADIRRTVRGAERAEYRLYGKQAPTNSPLRVSSELSRVLGFSDVATPKNWEFFQHHARFGGRSSSFNTNFASPQVAAILAKDPLSTFEGDPVGGEFGSDIFPTNSARFLLSSQPRAGLTRVRVVEIIRSANHADAPFRREWLYDKASDDVDLANAAINETRLAPVFTPAAGIN